MNFRVGDTWISSKKEVYVVIQIDETKSYYPLMVRNQETKKSYSCTPEGKIITCNYEDLGQLAIRANSTKTFPVTTTTRKVN